MDNAIELIKHGAANHSDASAAIGGGVSETLYTYEKGIPSVCDLYKGEFVRAIVHSVP